MLKKKSTEETHALSIPLAIFENRRISVLEAITIYLRDSTHLSFHEIASRMKRDDRTIWTSYTRGKKKLQ